MTTTRSELSRSSYAELDVRPQPIKKENDMNDDFSSTPTTAQPGRAAGRQALDPALARGTRRLAGKVAVITGAARGQGRSHAVRFAEEGADIIALDICADIPGIEYPMATREDLAETERMVRTRGANIVTAVVDVRDEEAVKAAVDGGVRELGGLDIVVGNAGVLAVDEIQEQPVDLWQTIFGVNVIGQRNLCVATLPHLVRGDGGAVVLTSSAVGLVGGPRLSAYEASKHAVVGLTKALAIEWGDLRVRVNSVAPGFVANTGILDGIGDRLAEFDEKEQTTFVTALPNQTVQPRDVSNAVLYLASDEAMNVTGTVIQVDAGLVTI
jgi:SDR family mycofactocin-dependent oxidoreductase